MLDRPCSAASNAQGFNLPYAIRVMPRAFLMFCTLGREIPTALAIWEPVLPTSTSFFTRARIALVILARFRFFSFDAATAFLRRPGPRPFFLHRRRLEQRPKRIPNRRSRIVCKARQVPGGVRRQQRVAVGLSFSRIAVSFLILEVIMESILSISFRSAQAGYSLRQFRYWHQGNTERVTPEPHQ